MKADAAFQRAFEFIRNLDRQASSRVERLPFGKAYLRPELPHVWSRNFVSLEIEPERFDFDTVIATAERIHVEAGLLHRRLAFDHEGTAGAAAIRLQPEGWRPGRVLLMAHRGTEAAPEPQPGAEEVERAKLRPLKRKLLGLDPQTRPKDVSDQLLEAYDVLGEAAGERVFAYSIKGEPVASCRLYSDGRTAQIEDVGTLPSHRGTASETPSSLLALQEAWASHDFVFLEAEEADWPKDWYERAGFEPVGVVCDLVRDP